MLILKITILTKFKKLPCSEQNFIKSIQEVKQNCKNYMLKKILCDDQVTVVSGAKSNIFMKQQQQKKLIELMCSC